MVENKPDAVESALSKATPLFVSYLFCDEEKAKRAADLVRIPE